MKLLYGTHWISEDEPCFGLSEKSMQSPGSRGFHRYQIIRLLRNDNLVEYRKDMGIAKKFKSDGFAIIGGVYDEINNRFYIEHTVGELVEMAEQMRNEPSITPLDYREIEQFMDSRDHKKLIFS